MPAYISATLIRGKCAVHFGKLERFPDERSDVQPIVVVELASTMASPGQKMNCILGIRMQCSLYALF